MSDDSQNKIVEIDLDETGLGVPNADIEDERRIAQFDILEQNTFSMAPLQGPYRLRLSVQEQRLGLQVTSTIDGAERAHQMGLSAFRKLIKDYFMICESYANAIRHATPSAIEAIDMGRRGLHNEGAQLLLERLDGKIEMDFDTARRLFTLVCALHQRQ
ncbi:MAG: UPF0262 family protein [Caulobacterales bacterium]